MIKAIIFDYYGVLTTDSYRTWLDRNPEIMREHGREIDALSRAQDAGLPDGEFFGRLASIAGTSAEQVRGEFIGHGLEHYGLVDYVRYLRRLDLKTAILSNATTHLYDEAAKHQLTDIFDVILCSEEAGFAKPDPKIYHLVLGRLGVSGAEAVFVDDRQYNVRGAEAVGITGILYAGVDELRAELVQLGVDAPVVARQT